MNITFISALCSKRLINKIINEFDEKPLQSVQKYHRLLCEGFANNDVSIKTISSIPIMTIKHGIFIKERNEIVNNVQYRYLSTINFKFLRHICLFVGSFFMTINDILKNKDNIFICDILAQSITLGSYFACKIFRRKCIAIITDRPIDIFKSENMIYKIQSNFDGYIFLTEAMNKDININNKPYVIIEGIIDSKNIAVNKVKKSKNNDFTIMYAGGLYEKYGLKILVDAIKNSNNKKLKLEIYGSGDMEKYLKTIDDKRINYCGLLTNDEILKKEVDANLLINPRFSNQEYVKYSFPSKTIEYMASGTPVLTTKLSGIPKEYEKYLFFIDNETSAGIQVKIEELFNMNNNKFTKFGFQAQKFVFDNKNKIVQGKKVIDMIQIYFKNNN